MAECCGSKSDGLTTDGPSTERPSAERRSPQRKVSAAKGFRSKGLPQQRASMWKGLYVERSPQRKASAGKAFHRCAYHTCLKASSRLADKKCPTQAYSLSLPPRVTKQQASPRTVNFHYSHRPPPSSWLCKTGYLQSDVTPTILHLRCSRAPVLFSHWGTGWARSPIM